tara:strand:- start:73 stop:552 length:480 start_codon:yes stop_codon:yes gene_type:complete
MENNGRVDISSYKNLTSYKFFDEQYNNHDFQKQGIKNIHVENKVSSLFFSRHNIDTLQSGIRYSVYKRSKHIIDNQSENDLMVIMRSIYLQYSKNLPYDIVEQVKRLNSMVLDYCVPNILREVNQYNNYTNDISSLPIPLEHAKNMSSKGTKINHMKEF